MKLQELSTPSKVKQIAKVYESYFNQELNFDRLNRRQTRDMLTRVQRVISEQKNSTSRHYAERNPSYLKLIMIEQALQRHLSEIAATPPVAPSAGAVAKPVDPKLKAAQDKLAKKQPLTPEEQEMINANAAAVTENRLRRAYRMLKESEVQQAQVVLAAQDMVDKMQGMLEDVSELQFKELPALVDSIKNQVGIDQATQFNTDATAALTGLMQNLQGAKQQLDAALGVVTGQAPAAGAMGMAAGAGMDAAGAADMAAGVPAPELGTEPGAELPAEELPPEGGEPPAGTLGRAKR